MRAAVHRVVPISTAQMKLGERLRPQRLEHRARRLEHVLDALRQRVTAQRDDGPVPPALLAAIDGFEQELRRVQRELHPLDREPDET